MRHATSKAVPQVVNVLQIGVQSQVCCWCLQKICAVPRILPRTDHQLSKDCLHRLVNVDLARPQMRITDLSSVM